MSRAASNGAGRFDLDKAVAAAAEGDNAPFGFTWHGEAFEIPSVMGWSLETQRLLGEGDLTQAMTMVMGPEEFARLEATGITLGQLTVLFNEIGRTAGVGGLPNSPPRAPRVSTPT